MPGMNLHAGIHHDAFHRAQVQPRARQPIRIHSQSHTPYQAEPGSFAPRMRLAHNGGKLSQYFIPFHLGRPKGLEGLGGLVATLGIFTGQNETINVAR